MTTTVRIGHSPDPDDAFMVWALAEGIVNAADFDVELVPKDIETLNRWAVEEQSLEATAISAAAFARVADKYWLLPHGASFGDGYGPVIVTKKPMTLAELADVTIATPGELTTAFAVLKLVAPHAKHQHRPFDKILPEVQKGKFEAGLVIHEGQLSWEKDGLHKVLDLGEWWKKETNLPLPLGLTALRKDLGRDLGEDVNALMKASIETGLALRGRALAYARQFGRGISEADADKFVSMYVNDMTVEMGDVGQRAVRELIRRIGAKSVKVEMAPEP